MAKKATSKETGRGARPAKSRGEQETGTAVQEMPQAKRGKGEVVSGLDQYEPGSPVPPTSRSPSGHRTSGNGMGALPARTRRTGLKRRRS